MILVFDICALKAWSYSKGRWWEDMHQCKVSGPTHGLHTLKLQHKIGFNYFHASNSGRSSLQAWLFIYVLSTRFGMLQQIHKKSGSAFLPQTSIWQVQVDVVTSTCPFQHQGLDLMHCFQNVDPWCKQFWRIRAGIGIVSVGTARFQETEWIAFAISFGPTKYPMKKDCFWLFILHEQQ